jgi:hypothetical protein
MILIIWQLTGSLAAGAGLTITRLCSEPNAEKLAAYQPAKPGRLLVGVVGKKSLATTFTMNVTIW